MSQPDVSATLSTESINRYTAVHLQPFQNQSATAEHTTSLHIYAISVAQRNTGYHGGV
jgi:hypothetical protein